MGRKVAKKNTGTGNKLPNVTPSTKCRLRALKLERIKDYLLMEEEFVEAQEEWKRQKNANTAEGEEETDPELKQVEEYRESPLGLCTLEEFVDDDHAIVSSPYGPDYYVSIMSFVDRDRLENGGTVLQNPKTQNIVGILNDNTDPMLNAMKVETAPKVTLPIYLF
jgi:26S proteasome regulatory subunit T2